MQPKIIKIEFNHDNFLRSQKTIWKFSNKKFIKSHITFTVWAALILSIDLFVNQKNHSPVSLGIICGYFFYILLGWFGFYERRVRFFKKRKNTAKRLEQESMDCIITFSENEIEYYDKEKLLKLNWSLFNPYLVFKDIIILIEKEAGGIMFTIDKNEISDTDYQELCVVLDNKIGFDKIIK
jgi:hypothetical protein